MIKACCDDDACVRRQKKKETEGRGECECKSATNIYSCNERARE
jgi:hypothetical protein